MNQCLSMLVRWGLTMSQHRRVLLQQVPTVYRLLCSSLRSPLLWTSIRGRPNGFKRVLDAESRHAGQACVQHDTIICAC